ncbi:ethanolamine ammonia-lyase subunit EutC [Nostocoides sp. F2B08]|uniref:ethanolamine ammonia-lyase subunit EutC n=1 Tax=Nostocoides sp. F2B08 TaxID=2653936 RepID=UPI00126338B9|nr:ethanolamine ammonia-lyase subunit EutC [Tetrasphaera sp. F2B08]KAB7744178.1 ethanolamine ammonia-lyase subunit EutC [Tetrasphaera sp. F2B08]
MSTGAFSTDELRSIVAEVLAELAGAGDATKPASAAPSSRPAARAESSSERTATGTGGGGTNVNIEVSDPTVPEERHRIGVKDPANPSGLVNLAASTSARLAVGRAGPRPPTRSVLLFGADHAVTQDAIFGDVPTELLERFGLFTVQTRVTSQDEFLLRPDLGRELDDDARRMVQEKCTKKPQVQIVVGDGLSAAAVTNNLPQIYPVLEQGLRDAGLTLGTPFFVRFCRVGVINDINDIVGADVVMLLIGERPGLGVADAMSVYSGWRPTAGKTDAHRDVICMITENGGTNPLEAGAFVVEHVKKVMKHQASGVELRLEESGSR